MASIDGDELLLQSRVDEQVVVDVYEADSAEYKYSFRTPNPSYILNDRMYQTADTTVVVFSIER